MNKKVIFHVIGLLLLGLAAVLLVPLIVALMCRPGAQGPGRTEWRAFLYTILICASVGGFLHIALRRHGRELKLADGFGIVTLGWITCTALGALPFYFADLGLSYSDCYFEAMSGFTTTGATIITATDKLPHAIESLPAGIGFWRCMTQWLGGMGIVLLTVAILPLLGAGGYQLFRAEVPGPAKDRMTPRIRETALTLWKVYLLLTVAEAILLLSTGMSLYDALCHTFTTLSTGGFSTRNASIGAYGPLTQWVVIVFMFLSGISFVLHYKAIFGGEPLGYTRRDEVKWYAVLILMTAGLLFVSIYGQTFSAHGGGSEAFTGAEKTVRTALFNAISIITTTGYANADYDVWPAMSRLLLLLCMFIGGCAGSTSGGIKVVRVILATRLAWRGMRQLTMPRAIIPVKFEGRSVGREILATVSGFIILWIFLVAVSSVVLAIIMQASSGPGTDPDMLTTFSAVISAIGNIGPGLGDVGPYLNYADIPVAGKWLLAALMLLGRLEIYGVLILLRPAAWRS
jgi:trk system potassium uptake protein TrkH